MSRYWEYMGQRVEVARTADIPAEYREGQRGHELVQMVLDGVKPWDEGDDPIETVTDMEPRPEIVVPISDRRVQWAKHIGHKARAVQLSPFVFTRATLTSDFTVELAGSASRPLLVRAYPGDYIPPLPWQVSARNADGGLQACLVFWRRHAYVYRPSRVVPGSETNVAPEWFSQ